MPTQPLVSLLSNGRGTYFAHCRWCVCSSPTVNAPDDLRVLALARSAGWKVTRRPDGTHELVCPRCVITREPPTVTSSQRAYFDLFTDHGGEGG